jgi:hypothetical protein
MHRWFASRTYSLILLGFIGSFALDWHKGGGTWVVVVPAAFALIGGRMAREVHLDRGAPLIPTSPDDGGHDRTALTTHGAGEHTAEAQNEEYD